MARKNSEGNFIIAAGGVGQYAVCPESWRLKMVERVKRQQGNNAINRSEGERLHSEWSKKVDAAAHLSQGLRFLLALLMTFVLMLLYYFIKQIFHV